MKYRKTIYILLGFCIALTIVCGVVVYQMSHFRETRVAFLDVGQGDATLISQGSRQILIDGGRDGTILLEQLGKQMPFWDRNIDIVIATHPDSDHIDGLISVFKNYSVDQFWHTNSLKDTSTYRNLMVQVKNEIGIEDVIAYSGLSAVIDDNTTLDVIYPFTSDVGDIDDINDASIATLLYIGDEIFYFGGDLTSDIENKLSMGDDITVLKASHHGSKSSTSNAFLQKTVPRDVIISTGVNNRYGHPHKDVIESILSIDAQILRTDANGTIVYKCIEKKCKVDFE